MSRYFLRFKSEAETDAAMSLLTMLAPEVAPDRPYSARRESHLVIADLGPEEVESAKESGAQVYEDVQFTLFIESPLQGRRTAHWAYWEEAAAAAVATAPHWTRLTQTDVMERIKAPLAWKTTRGQGVTIAIVDTGIAGVMPEFPASNRSPSSVTFAFSDPWSDTAGHGSMCACAAAGTDSQGGRFNGVAPDAQLLSARTTLFSTDIYKIYDHLIDEKASGRIGPLVISNSYGLYRCDPPTTLPQDHPYLDIVREAVANGIVVVFAAGNNHYDVLCNHDPAAFGPNTIWGVNSIDEVLTVGTVDPDDRNDQPNAHANSSRGPGQWASAGQKPDVVAPTYGEIVWGDGYRHMEWWGTSGACPQVAGLAALILAVNPGLSPAEVAHIIRSTATPLGQPPECVGAGLINCEEAVAKAARG